MSAGRDKKARTNQRAEQRVRALGRRAQTRAAMLERRVAKQAYRRALKARNAA